MLQKPFLRIKLTEAVPPVNQWEISLRARALQCSQTMALFRSLGSRHIWREPSGLQWYVREDTQSVGQETGAMTLWVWPYHWESALFGLGTLWALSYGHTGQGEWKGQSWWCRYWSHCLWCQRSEGMLTSGHLCPRPPLWEGQLLQLGWG